MYEQQITRTALIKYSYDIIQARKYDADALMRIMKEWLIGRYVFECLFLIRMCFNKTISSSG